MTDPVALPPPPSSPETPLPRTSTMAIVSLITGSSMVTGQTLLCDGGALLADPASCAVRSQ